MPGTWPTVSSSMREIAKPPVTGPKWTVAFVWMRVGAWPFCDSAADRAIEKHAACGNELLGVCAGTLLKTRLERISSLKSAATKLERAGAVLQVATPFSVGNSLCHHSLPLERD